MTGFDSIKKADPGESVEIDLDAALELYEEAAPKGVSALTDYVKGLSDPNMLGLWWMLALNEERMNEDVEAMAVFETIQSVIAKRDDMSIHPEYVRVEDEEGNMLIPESQDTH